MASALGEQKKAVFVMMGLAIISVLAMIVLGVFQSTLATYTTTLINTTVTAFIAAFALFGSFATLTALFIVIKAIVKGAKSMS